MAQVAARHPGVDRSVEDGERVGQLVVAEGQHGLVDDHHRQLGARHRVAGGVGHGHVDAGRAAGLGGRGRRLDRQAQRAAEWRNLQGEPADGEGRPVRRVGQRIAGVGGAPGGADQVDLDVDVGDVVVFDGDGQDGARVLDGERFLGDEAVAADGEQPFGGAEGSLDQDLGGVAGGVLLLVRDEGGLFLHHVALRSAVAAAHPAGELAAAGAAGIVGHGGDDLIGAPDVGLEGAFDRRLAGGDRAGLDFDGHFFPAPVEYLPVQPARLEGDGPGGDGVPVDVGDDGFDHERLVRP